MPGGRIEVDVDIDTSKAGAKLSRDLRGIGDREGRHVGRTLGLAIVGGFAAAGVGRAVASTLKIGTEFQDQLNTLQAVSGANVKQMAAVRAEARALGNDLTLPATSAKDAAEGMTELAKGGLSVEQSMRAAKGTLQLAAAAQVDAATAATIQANALNAFALSGDHAGHVADVLANTANAASGEITDFAQGMQQTSAVAHSFGISLDDTATALGIFANLGIKGSDAGTSLKTMLLALASPSAPAVKALHTLGVEAFDAQGRFVGLQKVSGQLADAQKRLTREQFLQAAATAFGTDATRAATALAQAGATGFDKMATAVGRQGGAAEVAAAKTKGLGGAIEGFKSQIETIQIDAFTRAAPGLETLVRKASAELPKLEDIVFENVDKAAVAASTFGPEIARSLAGRGAAIAQAGRTLLSPLVSGAAALVSQTLPYVLRFSSSVTADIRELTREVTPLANALGRDLTSAAHSAGGPVQAVGQGLEFTASAAHGAVVALGPILSVLRTGANVFASLPGPLQSTVVALGAISLLRNRFTGAETAIGRARSTLTGFTDQMRVQASLAAAEGRSITNMGAAFGTLQARVPALSTIGSSFRRASGEAGTFAGTLRGSVAAAATGSRLAMGGLVSFLGGPWGIALAGGVLALGLFAAKSQAAKERQRELAAAGKAVADAIDEQNGVINENVRRTTAQQLAQAKLLTQGQRYGLTSGQIVDAVLQQGEAYDQVRGQLLRFAEANSSIRVTPGRYGGGPPVKVYNEAGQAALDYAKSLDTLIGKQHDQLAIDQAINGSTAELTGPLKTLSGDFSTLADNESEATDKASALKSALDLMSGGHLSAEQATKQLNDATRNIVGVFEDAAKGAKAVGTSLLDQTGGINTATEAGSALFETVQGIAEAQAQAAQSAYDMAITQGRSIPQAQAAASAAMKGSYTSFLQAAEAAGLNARQAENLAKRYGLLPSQVVTLLKLEGTGTVGQQLGLVQQQIAHVPAGKTITLQGDVGAAVAAIQRAGGTARQTADGRYVITVNAATQAAINTALAAQRQINNMTATIHVQARPVTGGIGIGNQRMSLYAYASGGFFGLNPMRGGTAAIVQPNTWRVIGDNPKVPEAYVPIDRSSARSHKLLAELNRQMGYAAVRLFANGGFYAGSQAGPSAGQGWPDSMAFTHNVYLDGEPVRARVETRFSQEARDLRLTAGRAPQG